MSAVYSGDANYAPGTSATVIVTITPGPVKLSLSCVSMKLRSGQSLSCEATATELILPVSGTLEYTLNIGESSTVTLKDGQAPITIFTAPPCGQ